MQVGAPFAFPANAETGYKVKEGQRLSSLARAPHTSPVKSISRIWLRGNGVIQRFIWLAIGYWKGQTQSSAWLLSVGFLICLVVNTYMALAVNRWSKSFFDALQTHEVMQ
jgi:ABC-type uncharacterized transport system fused permease/ATPase subunit